MLAKMFPIAFMCNYIFVCNFIVLKLSKGLLTLELALRKCKSRK